MEGDPVAGPEGERQDGARLSLPSKARLAAIVVLDFVVVSLGLRLTELASLVKRLRRPPKIGIRRLDPMRLGRIVDRVLRLGPLRPRCLPLSLVFFRLLRRQGTHAELVIGLGPEARGHEAHAWVEVAGEVVGPPPGRLGHEALVRYGSDGPSPAG